MEWIVKVPATTANIGPGFDVLGLALDIYNIYKVQSASKFSIQIQGEGAEILPKDESNLVVRCFKQILAHYGKQVDPYAFEINNSIPLSRGLGSSASAIIGAIFLAYQVLNRPLNAHEILKWALPWEGHADNLTPALLGGLQMVFYQEPDLHFKKLAIHPDLRAIVVIPEGYISTEQARSVLPKNVALKDCIFNMHRLALTIQYLEAGDIDGLIYSLEDRLHQSYRLKLLSGLWDLFQLLQKLMCGWVVSGSGPTLLHFIHKEQTKDILDKIKPLISKSKLQFKARACLPVIHGLL